MEEEITVELHEVLNLLEIAFIDIERNPESFSTYYTQLYRYMHNLKGTAGMLGFDLVGTIMHNLESHLKIFEGCSKIEDTVLDYLLNGIEACRSSLKHEPYVFTMIDSIIDNTLVDGKYLEIHQIQNISENETSNSHCFKTENKELKQHLQKCTDILMYLYSDLEDFLASKNRHHTLDLIQQEIEAIIHFKVGLSKVK